MANAVLYEAYEDAAPRAKVVGLAERGFGGGKGPGPTAATGAIDRGLDFIAHETGHAIGLAHAHSGDHQHLGDLSVRDRCAAHDGAINGVGIDPRLGSGPEVGTFKLVSAEKAGVFDATPDAPAAVYDYMSYCSSELAAGGSRTWVSTGYWANQVRELRPGGGLITDFGRGCCFLGAASDPRVPRRARAAGGRRTAPIVRVSAVLGANGDAGIFRVEPDRGAADPPATGSDVAIVVRDRSGAEISRTPVLAQVSGMRPAPGQAESPPSRIVNAAVPGERAARVDLEAGGQVVASREASASAPRATLRRPRKGARIAAKGRFPVRWRASDADGDPLQTKVQFSADRGRSWQTLDLGVRGTRARIRGSLLPRTRGGMLRVVVSDGFNVARSVARRIRAQGGRPEVEIMGLAGKRTTVLADTVLVLEASAVDATGKPLRGKHLVWKSNGKRLGLGERIGVPAHVLGRTVTVVGRDRAGRRGKDRARFRVRRVAPIFTTLRAKRLGRRAPKLRLRAASSLPARLIVRGRGLRRTRAKLRRGAQTIEVKTRGRHRGTYGVRLTLEAAGKTTRQRLEVRRHRPGPDGDQIE